MGVHRISSCFHFRDHCAMGSDCGGQAVALCPFSCSVRGKYLSFDVDIYCNANDIIWIASCGLFDQSPHILAIILLTAIYSEWEKIYVDSRNIAFPTTRMRLSSEWWSQIYFHLLLSSSRQAWYPDGIKCMNFDINSPNPSDVYMRQ